MRDWAHHQYTWAQYLNLERDSEHKNEFFNGEIYAMAGGTPQHALLAANVIGDLRPKLKDGPCKSFTSDLRIRVAATGLATYPDVSVVCGPFQTDPADKNTILNPTVLIEVMSPSTESYDRGAKFEQYKQIPTLKEYVLVSDREQLVEVFRRTGDDWKRTEARAKSSLRLESIDAELSVDSLYAGVELRD